MTELSPVDAVLERLAHELPATFDRATAHAVTGGLAHKRTLANMDSLGTGPTGAIRRGSKIFYERGAFLVWLKDRLTPAKVRESADHAA